MRIAHLFFTLLFVVLTQACHQKPGDQTDQKQTEVKSNNLAVDHFNIWVSNPELAKSKLEEIGFRFYPDSLTTPHVGQGTSGKYSNFLNSYLELIYVNDLEELTENNRTNNALDFTLRAGFQNNGSLPFSIALRLEDYHKDSIPFKTVAYHQEWMEADVNIYTAVNAKTKPAEPSVFVVYPGIQAPHFDNMDSVMNIPVEHDAFRQSFVHPNGAQKVSKIVITSKNLDLSSETMLALLSIELVEVKNGQEQLMELYFDNQKQGKSFDLRPDLPIKIHL